MRIIAIINQKGGVGKTTTVANLGAALARAGQRVVVFDMDPQANLSLYLGSEVGRGEASVYGVLTDGLPIPQATRPTTTPGLFLVPSHLDLSGAELELASTLGRETLLRDAITGWVAEHAAQGDLDAGPADYVLLDCPPSLGLLSINALVAADEVMIAVQTEFFALQGLSKLVEVVQLLRRRMNPALNLTGIIPCLYDSRLKLAREVLVELRKYFPGKVFSQPIRTNVRLAESPSYGQTIFEYAPDSNGAKDYQQLANEILGLPKSKPAPRPAVQVVADEQAKELQRAAQALKDLEAQGPAALEKAKSEPALPAESGVQPEGAAGVDSGAAPASAPALEPESEPHPHPAASSAAEIHTPEPSSTPEAAPEPAPTRSPRPEEFSEVDAELATYEIPRQKKDDTQIDLQRWVDDGGSPPNQPWNEGSKGQVLVPQAGPAWATPSANTPKQGIEPQGTRNYTSKDPQLAPQEAQRQALSASSAASLAVAPEPLAGTESEATEPEWPSEAEAEAPAQPDREAAASPEESDLEPSPIEATAEDENRPAATPVFGHMHYMGEDRWTQRPQS